MSSRKHSSLPQAIQYLEVDEHRNDRGVRGPFTYEVFEKRYKSNEWPSVNYKTQIWNGTEFKQWTPIFAIDSLFKKLDPKKYRQFKQKEKEQQQQQHHHQQHQQQQQRLNNNKQRNKGNNNDNNHNNNKHHVQSQSHHNQHNQNHNKSINKNGNHHKSKHREHKEHKQNHKIVNEHKTIKSATMTKKKRKKMHCNPKEIYDKYQRYKQDIITTIKTTKCSRVCYCFNFCNWSRASCELIKWLVISRGFIFIFGIGISHFLDISPFDSSSEMLNNRLLDKFHNSWLDTICLKYLNCFSNWDGQYFLHIAQYGYEHEKIYAFYPGLPLIINSIILFIRKLFYGLHFKSMALICGIIWNGFISTYFSAIILYYLTVKIYNKPSIALITAKLFLINPASIFFCSIYTESTFAFVSFLLMLCCELKYFDCNNKLNKYSMNNLHSCILTVSIVLCIIIASSLRSNGILIIGFPIYYHIYSNWFLSNNIINALSFIRYKVQTLFCLNVLHGDNNAHHHHHHNNNANHNKKKHKNGYHHKNHHKHETKSDDINKNKVNPKYNNNDINIMDKYKDNGSHWKLSSLYLIILYSIKFIGLLCLLCIGLSPWFYYQYWSQRKLCTTTNILSSDRSYCHSFWSTVYSYVQYNYWKCGLLMRWNVNEIGNFLLASPIWYISYYAIRHYTDQFLLISSVSSANIKNLTSSLWSTINAGFKKLVKISTNNVNNHNNNKNSKNNKNNNNGSPKTSTNDKQNSNIYSATEQIQVSMNKFLNSSDGNNHHQNGKNKRKNGNIFTVASGLQLLKSMGMIDNLTNYENEKDREKAKKIVSQFDNEILLNHKLIPYVIYWFLLWMICVFYAHVQISTRFICCSCPPLYWFCAEIIYSSNYNDDNQNNLKQNHNKKRFLDNFIDAITQKPTPKLIIAYFLLYFTIGTIAFCSFLPFV